MLDQLEALRALHETGTTARAALRLRLTQSAISKRVAALEAAVGVPLHERVGRGGALTPAGRRLLADAVPLLARLRDVVAAAAGGGDQVVRVAASESLLSSWLPATLADIRARSPALRLELHAHRGPALLARVASGDVDVAVGVDAPEAEGIVSRRLGDEPMVIAPRGFRALRARGAVDAWTIEERSLTWASLLPRLRRRSRPWGVDLRFTGRLESFTALARCAEAGLAHVVVPRAIALAAGAPERVLVPLPGLERPLAVMGRKLALGRPAVAAFAAALVNAWPPRIVGRRGR